MYNCSFLCAEVSKKHKDNCSHTAEGERPTVKLNIIHRIVAVSKHNACHKRKDYIYYRWGKVWNKTLESADVCSFLRNGWNCLFNSCKALAKKGVEKCTNLIYYNKRNTGKAHFNCWCRNAEKRNGGNAEAEKDFFCPCQRNKGDYCKADNGNCGRPW